MLLNLAPLSVFPHVICAHPAVVLCPPKFENHWISPRLLVELEHLTEQSQLYLKFISI